MATSKIKARDFASVEYNIPNDTDPHTFYYPPGYTGDNCMLVSAKCYTKYSSWVDSRYGNGTYFGNFKYLPGYFEYTAEAAGNASKIVFTFAKVS